VLREHNKKLLSKSVGRVAMRPGVGLAFNVTPTHRGMREAAEVVFQNDPASRVWWLALYRAILSQEPEGGPHRGCGPFSVEATGRLSTQ
jgi:hypothetical protein